MAREGKQPVAHCTTPPSQAQMELGVVGNRCPGPARFPTLTVGAPYGKAAFCIDHSKRDSEEWDAFEAGEHILTANCFSRGSDAELVVRLEMHPTDCEDELHPYSVIPA